MRRHLLHSRALHRAAAAATVTVLVLLGSGVGSPLGHAAGIAAADQSPPGTGRAELSGGHPPQLRLDTGPADTRWGSRRESAVNIYGPGIWHRAQAGRTWYGGYFSLPGSSLQKQVSYCIDAGLKSPYPRYFTQSEPQTIASPETAWALSTHSSSAAASMQAALAAIARLDSAIPHDHAIPPAEPKHLGDPFRAAAGDFAHVTKDAADLAGPYAVELKLSGPELPVLDGPATPAAPAGAETPAAPARVGTPAGHAAGSAALAGQTAPTGPAPVGPATRPVTKPAEIPGGRPPLTATVRVLSAAGEAVEDIALRVEVDGGTTEKAELRSTDSLLTIPVTPETSATKVTVKVKATGLPATDVLVFDPVDPATGKPASRVQSVVTAGKPASASAQQTIAAPPPPETPMPTPDTVPPPAPSTAPPSSAPPSPTPPASTPPTAEPTAPPTTAVPPTAPTTAAPSTAAPSTQAEATTPPAVPAPQPTRAQPQVQQPPRDELPRTGSSGSGAVLGAGLLFIGCGVAALTIARGLRSRS